MLIYICKLSIYKYYVMVLHIFRVFITLYNALRQFLLVSLIKNKRGLRHIQLHSCFSDKVKHPSTEYTPS